MSPKDKSGKKKRPKKDLELTAYQKWWKHSFLRRMWKPVSGAVGAVFLPTLGLVMRVYFLALTRGLRTEVHGPLFDYIREKRPCIITLWHEDPFPGMVEFFRHTRDYPTMAMASGGRIGRIGGYLLGLWHVKAIHGSSSGGGIEAVERLTRKVRERGVSVMMTADGSRGPHRVAKWGAIHLARETGLPIIALRGWARHNIILVWTWPKLALPIPWGRHVVLSTEPLFIPPDADKGQLEGYRKELETRMNTQADLSVRLALGKKE